MTDGKSNLTRREFLVTTGTVAGATAVGALGIGAACQRLQPVDVKIQTEVPTSASSTSAPGPRATVVLVRDASVLKPGRAVDAAVIAKILDDGVAALFGKPAAEVWPTLFRPDDVVGIKSNVWQFLATPPELEQALRERVQGCGIAPDNIAIDDRGIRSNPVFKRATALINVRPMRTHHWAGVGSLIKNYIMFSDAPFTWHVDSCANLAGIWDMPEVKGKTRLNVLVMLTPLFHGKGPHHYHAQYTWEYNGLLVGTDPVAVDATGVRILEAKRREYFGKDEPLSVSPKHIWVADQKYHLGIADPARIDVKKVGLAEGALI